MNTSKSVVSMLGTCRHQHIDDTNPTSIGQTEAMSNLIKPKDCARKLNQRERI